MVARQRDRASTQANVGNLLWEMGKRAEALAAEAKALALLQRLANAHPTEMTLSKTFPASTQFQRDLAGATAGLAPTATSRVRLTSADQRHSLPAEPAVASPAASLWRKIVAPLTDNRHFRRIDLRKQPGEQP